MWSRSELKSRAKWVLKQCYWKAVLVSLILAVITGELFGNSGSNREISDTIRENGGMPYLAFVITTIMAVLFVLFVVGIAIDIFLFGPLEVNIRRFFIISRVEPAELNELGFSFRNSYMNVVKIQFLRGLFNFLWFLLLIVPGIIKFYEYRMIPYILAEHPEMDSQEVFRLSRDMMNGEKWNTFVLDLSFIGWRILGALTCGILLVFYVCPYQNLTNVELYDVLKNKLFGSANVE